MVGSDVDVKGRVVGFAVWPKLSGVEVKGCIQKICLELIGIVCDF